LISEKEQELKSLQDELGLIEQVLARNSLSSPTTRVQFYQGVEGVRQIQWNQTRTKTEILSMIDEPINEVLGKAFTLRWAETMNSNSACIRMLASPHFKEVNDVWYLREKLPERLIAHETMRIISPEVMRISSNMDIWNDVVAYYNWHDGEIFGVELYNQDIADMQRQLFEPFWRQANTATADK
jgi:hypothetical protein